MKQFADAFTLIEVLLVVSVISLVSSVTFVNLQDARADARDTARKENGRQVQTAMELYRNDKGTVPGNPGTVYEPSAGDENEPIKTLVESGTLPQDPGGSQGGGKGRGKTSYDKYYRADPATTQSFEYMMEYELEQKDNISLGRCGRKGKIWIAEYSTTQDYLSFVYSEADNPSLWEEDDIRHQWEVDGYDPSNDTWEKITLYQTYYTGNYWGSSIPLRVTKEKDSMCHIEDPDKTTGFFPASIINASVTCSKINSLVQNMFERAYIQATNDICNDLSDHCVCGR